MGTGTMKIGDILRYSVKIENESESFYRDAVEKVKEESVKTLLKELEAEEVKHAARLTDILASAEDIEAEGFEHENVNKLIQNKEIPFNISEQDLLNIALEREKNTRDFYSQVLTITNLDSDIDALFQMLYNQERGHFARISKLLEKLQS